MSALDTLFKALKLNVPFSPPSSWLQGRTAYGGFSSALALKIAHDANSSQNTRLRSAQVSFVGPVTENIIFIPEILRVGKSATYISVKGIIDESVVIQATFVFANARVSQILHQRISIPETYPANHYSELPHKLVVPDFFRNFRVRLASDSLFFSGGPKPELIAWVQLKDGEDISSELVLLLIGDSLPPASTVCFPQLAPISSMDWSFQVIDATIKTEWFLLKSSSVVSSDGYSHQTMQVWSEDGQLMMIGTQNVAIFI